MIERLDREQQRRLAIAILAGIVALLFGITVLPVWMANASRQAELDDAFARLQRYEQVAATDRELLPKYEALRREQQARGNHLRSETVAVAGAELQRRVKDIAAAHQAQIVSTQILPATSENGFARVSLRVRLRGTLPGILQSIYDIETDTVHMFLDNVSLRSGTVRVHRKEAEARPMDAEFDLIAFMPEDT